MGAPSGTVIYSSKTGEPLPPDNISSCPTPHGAQKHGPSEWLPVCRPTDLQLPRENPRPSMGHRNDDPGGRQAVARPSENQFSLGGAALRPSGLVLAHRQRLSATAELQGQPDCSKRGKHHADRQNHEEHPAILLPRVGLPSAILHACPRKNLLLTTINSGGNSGGQVQSVTPYTYLLGYFQNGRAR